MLASATLYKYITKKGRSVVGRVPRHEVAVTLATVTSLNLSCVEDTMAVVLEDIGRSSRLLFVFKSVGDIFIRMLEIASVIEKFVWRKSATEEVHQKDCIDEEAVSSSFVAETQNLFHFHPLLLKCEGELFHDFHDFSLKCGKPIATVLSSSRVICRKCGKKLASKNKVISVVIYSSHRSTYLGSQLTKVCRKYKIYEQQ